MIATAKRVLRIEGEAILAMAERVGDAFSRSVELILACQHRTVVTGMGKSGLICRKIVATLASTGTPALFLDPADGLHGDLGMLTAGDVMIAVSNSGETEEVLRILPLIKRMGLPLIAMSGKARSTLARAGDVFLDVSVAEEACPLGLAPTASTTATLAMGDALAVALLERKGFSAEDFALIHPGGALGKRLLLRVEDLMHCGDELPLVTAETPLLEALFVITEKKLGLTGVLDGEGALVGVFTDGDLRRAMGRGYDVLDAPIRDMMTPNPKGVFRSDLAARALKLMEDHAITSLFVFDEERSREPVGILHVHDLLKAGIY